MTFASALLVPHEAGIVSVIVVSARCVDVVHRMVLVEFDVLRITSKYLPIISEVIQLVPSPAVCVPARFTLVIHLTFCLMDVSIAYPAGVSAPLCDHAGQQDGDHEG